MTGKKSNIYTKTGDDGTTGLVGGTRIKKNDLRLDAYGTVDELNTHIGIILTSDLPAEIRDLLFEVQNKLFNIGSRLASDEKGNEITVKLSITEDHINMLEMAIDKIEEDLTPLKQFILPGGSVAAARCHIARAVCRRAERCILDFAERQKVQPEVIRYMNRLSDFLFVLARKFNKDKGVDEKNWKH
jgi:cob(I)alamin adenosyltransferase